MVLTFSEYRVRLGRGRRSQRREFARFRVRVEIEFLKLDGGQQRIAERIARIERICKFLLNF